MGRATRGRVDVVAGGGPVDSVVFVPGASTIYYATPVTLEVSLVAGVKAVYIFAESALSPAEVVYASPSGGEPVGVGTFGTKYSSGVRSGFGSGFAYTFARSGGWPGSFLKLTAHVFDAAGVLTVVTAFYTIIPAAALVSVAATVDATVTHENDAIGLLLTADNDLDLSTGGLRFSRGAVAAEQNARLRLGLIKGEWYLDLADGTDWLGMILVKNPNLPAVNVHLRERLLGGAYVTEVTRQAIEFDPLTRQARIVVRAQTNFGDTGVITAGVNI